jgi:multidrug efflux pump subunit AcrB
VNLATWSIRNPIPSILLFVVLSLAGIWGFASLPIQNLPDLELPEVVVTLSQPGAAPAQLETEVARKVEDSVATLSGVRHVRTSIGDGTVVMRVEFVFEKPLSEALLETRNAIDRVRSDLPTTVLPASVTAKAFGEDPTVTYSVMARNLNEESLSWYIDDRVAKTVLAVPGVGRFERLGGVQREVRMDIDPVRLASLGATINDVSRALRRVQQETSGGLARIGGGEQAFRTTALVTSAADLSGLRIVLADGRQIRLDQVATVHDGIADRTQAALLDGESAVGFNVYRAKGYDETKVALGVRAALDQIGRDKPVSFRAVAGSVDYTVQQYHGSMDMLVEGAVLAVLIVWLFLRDWRATVIAATALPLSILPAFAAMQWLGYSLNTITLLALSVIVGILVDDAIVEVENIERHMHMGKPIRKATEEAVSEIALAVTATTLSLVAVFLPTAMMTGIPGLLFKQFGWTAVFAVSASLLVARLLTPVMAIYFLKIRLPRHAVDGRLMTAYLATIRWCLQHRGTTFTAGLGFTIGSLALLPLLPTGFIPPADRGVSTISIELPPGSTLPMTLKVAEAARHSFAGVDGVRSVFTTVGGAGDSDIGDIRRASLILTLAPRGERAGQMAIEEAVRQRLLTVPGARFTLSSGGQGEKLELVLASDDEHGLKLHASNLERELRGLNGLSNISSTASLERPEIVIHPDDQRAAEQGITTEAIGDFVRVATSGDFDQEVARLNLDNRQVYIRVRMPDATRTDLETLGAMRINGRRGPVPLASVASLSIGSGPSAIDRYDRQRYVTITADLGGMPLGDAQAAVAALPATRSLPVNAKLIEVGDSELAADLASGFGLALGIGVLAIFCVLTLLFKDFFQPITILSAIPLSTGGALIALLIAGSELDVPAMIGLVMLTGIVTKNSILLVEYAVLGISERNLTVHEALVDACHKRARPIIMTTIAMMAGMTPIALGLGADASFRQPMAIAVIGGLLTSTALSLLVVPVVFTYIAAFERALRNLFTTADRIASHREASNSTFT